MARRKASSAPTRTRAARRVERPVVLVLPGIMGSDLDDTSGGHGRIWIDPFGILLGQLGLLRLAPNGADDAEPSVHIEATGVVDLYYDEIKKKLKKKGFDARQYAFDWRRDIADLAARLADDITQQIPADRPLSVVAHSMGGLVSRTLFASHPQVAARVNRLIMLGTPNFGSFSPAQVFSGDDTMVRIVSGLDLVNSGEDLIATFASFPGLVAMLPDPAKVPQPNFLALGTWPQNLFPPTALQRARALQLRRHEDLASRSRYTLIAGMGRDTVASATMVARGEFKFSDGDGDGTVPLDLCLLPNVGQTYFTDAKHGSMPTDNDVIRAVVDILTRGEAALPKSVPSRRSQRALRPHRSPDVDIPKYITAAQHRLTCRKREPSPAARRQAAQRVIAKLTRRQRREIQGLALKATEAFVAPPTRVAKAAIAVEPAVHAADRVPRRLLVKTALGTVTAAPSTAIVLGVFPAVQPQGSLAALDTVVHGYVTQLFQQGAIHGGAGEVMFLPTPGASMPAELAVLVGLGEARLFSPVTLERVGENLARALTQVRVPDISTVAIGSGSLPLSTTLVALLRGFLIGLSATDPDSVFRSITICETDPQRIVEIRHILNESLGYWRERGIELELKEIPDLPAPEQPARRYRDLAYWIETVPTGLRVFLMGSAVNIEERIETSTADLAVSVIKLQAAMENEMMSDVRKASQQRSYGERLARLVPKDLVAQMARRPRFDQATIELAESAAMVPWELLRVGRIPASLHLPVVRRLGISADHRPAADYMLSEKCEGSIRIAIVADPTGDLPGARKEGEHLVDQLRRSPAFEVASFIGPEQCRERTLFELIGAGAVDVLHYAGHGCFNPDRPETSGLLINGDADGILTAAEIRRCRRAPLLIFINACQVGIVPPRAVAEGRARPKRDRRLRARQPYGFAEALLQIGVRAYIGTFWSIPDDAAVTFARDFYRSVADGASLGEATLRARKKTLRSGSSGRWAWASYMLYGPAWLRLVGRDAA